MNYNDYNWKRNRDIIVNFITKLDGEKSKNIWSDFVNYCHANKIELKCKDINSLCESKDIDNLCDWFVSNVNSNAYNSLTVIYNDLISYLLDCFLHD